MVRKPRRGDILLLNTAPRSGQEQTGTKIETLVKYFSYG